MNGLKTSRRQTWILGPISVLLLLALACGTASAPKPQVTDKTAPAAQKGAAAAATPTPAPPSAIQRAIASGKVTMMVAGFSNERFDPAFAESEASVYARLLHALLISTNEKLELLPGIASAWSFSTDGKTLTVTVRKGTKFHDGTDLTSEDVLWSWRHSWSPEAKDWTTSALSIVRGMEKIERTGPDQVSLTTKTPRPDFPIHFLSEAASKMYGIMPKQPKLHDEEAEAAYDKNPIGAGSLKLVKHTPAFSMAFERFDDYYYQPKNGFPEDKRVNFRFLDLLNVKEEATRVAAIRAGQADIAPASLTVKKQVEAGGGRMIFGREGSYFWVTFLGCLKPEFPCYDKRVRQSLNYAVDKQVMRDKLFGPEVMQVKGWQVVTPSSIGYGPELDPRPYDPNRARQLLADAGFAGGKGFGKLIINTWASSATPLLIEAVQLAADSWKRELGIDVEVKVGDQVAIQKDFRAGKLPGQILWRDNDTRIDAADNLIDTYGAPGDSRRIHENPEITDLFLKTIVISDIQERHKAFNAMYRRLREESYQIDFGYFDIPWALGPRISNWIPYPMSPFPSAMHTITLK